MEVNRQAIQKMVENILDAVDQGGGLAENAPPRRPTTEPLAREPSVLSGASTASAEGTRIIVTALGRNAPGIAAGITGALSEVRGDVLDMSQTLLGDFFAMVVVVDISQATTDFGVIKETLMERGVALGVRVICQHEDVFRSMHRI